MIDFGELEIGHEDMSSKILFFDACILVIFGDTF
jgi:hypothetical protein